MAEQLQLCLTFDTLITPRGDGSFIVTPRRLQRPVTELFTRDVMRRTGLKARAAQDLMRKLGARQTGPNCLLRIDAAALETALQRKCGEN